MSADVQKIVLGTRGSELALTQARLVETAIRNAWPQIDIEIRTIATTGDKTKIVDGRAGWKGLFTAEIERALIAGEVDVAVHSAKDLPSQTSPDSEIAAVLPRGFVEDVLVSKQLGGLAGLGRGAKVATSSVRRKHQLLWQRPDLSVIDLRGNVPTRLRKLAENDWAAVVLAHAGLQRLGVSLDGFFAEVLPLERFLPPGGQGIIALQIRAHDRKTKAIVDPVNDLATLLCLQAERAFLRLLNIDCNAPVGVLAKIENGRMNMQAQFFEVESAAPRVAEVEGEPEASDGLAEKLISRLRLRV